MNRNNMFYKNIMEIDTYLDEVAINRVVKDFDRDTLLTPCERVEASYRFALRCLEEEGVSPHWIETQFGLRTDAVQRMIKKDVMRWHSRLAPI